MVNFTTLICINGCTKAIWNANLIDSQCFTYSIHSFWILHSKKKVYCQVVYTVGAVAAAYELYSSVTQVLVLENEYQYQYPWHQYINTGHINVNIKIGQININMGNININIRDPGHRALQEAPTAQRLLRWERTKAGYET